ncbi:hypothetical protein KDL01_35745 [Actinospica durhamensis]|uniref:Uncharacterized protein n=1 Tax=Actinospica durhamensis TaxID=1508375 RepID=A0A941IU71_9ACTN|nr:hypothetical protein [Actinospica durhamensis]MBR7838677.1 hypothetical protein [Actinospica durhamensis]
MTRILRAAAVTAALATAALVNVPTTAFADASDASDTGPASISCDYCHIAGGDVFDFDDGQGIDETPAYQAARTIAIDVSPNVGVLRRGEHRPGSNWPAALPVGTSTVRVDTRDQAYYQGINDDGSVLFVIDGDQTHCVGRGRLICRADGPNLVRVFRL